MTPPKTQMRYVFDVAFGIIVPVVCFYYDPLILKQTPPLTCGSPLLGINTAYYVYPAVGIGILTLLIWLRGGDWLPKWGAFFSGIFLTGTVTAIILGLPLVIFGFPAWLAAYVYGRNAKEAWQLAEPTANKGELILRILAGVLFLLGLTWIGFFLLKNLFPPVVVQTCPDV